jgi:putative phage-type endonuclease
MQNKQEWLKGRKKYIGGSDIAAIVGLNKYRTPLDVYLDKTSEDIQEDTNSAMRWGTRLEDVIAKAYAEDSGQIVWEEKKVCRHKEYPFLAANIDRWVGDREYVLECKTAGFMKAKEWGEEYTDQIPESYLCQVAWYSAITEVPKVDIAVLIGGQDFRIYTYHKNQDFEDKLITIGKNFWLNHVQKGIPPECSTLHDISSLYPRGNGKEISSTEEVTNNILKLKAMNEEKESLETAINVLKKNIQEYIRDYDILIDDSGNVLATWKNTSPRACLDLKRFKQECQDIYLKYVNYSKQTRVFLVK